MKLSFIFERPLSTDAFHQFRIDSAKYDSFYGARLMAVLSVSNCIDYNVGAFENFSKMLNPVEFIDAPYEFARFEAFPDGREIFIEDILHEDKCRYISEYLRYINSICEQQKKSIAVIFPTAVKFNALMEDRHTMDYFIMTVKRILRANNNISILIRNSSFVRANDSAVFELAGSTPNDSYELAKFLRATVCSNRIGYCIDTSEYYSAESFAVSVEALIGGKRLNLEKLKDFVEKAYKDKMLKLIIASRNQGDEQLPENKGFGFTPNFKPELELLADTYCSFSSASQCPIAVRGRNTDEQNESGILIQSVFNEAESVFL